MGRRKRSGKMSHAQRMAAQRTATAVLQSANAKLGLDSGTTVYIPDAGDQPYTFLGLEAEPCRQPPNARLIVKVEMGEGEGDPIDLGKMTTYSMKHGAAPVEFRLPGAGKASASSEYGMARAAYFARLERRGISPGMPVRIRTEEGIQTGIFQHFSVARQGEAGLEIHVGYDPLEGGVANTELPLSAHFGDHTIRVDPYAIDHKIHEKTPVEVDEAVAPERRPIRQIQGQATPGQDLRRH